MSRFSIMNMLANTPVVKTQLQLTKYTTLYLRDLTNVS